MAGMLVVTGLAACMPTNDLMPLRGEDPEALALSAQRADWTRKTGATRAFEQFWTALRDAQYDECRTWLGPDTQAVLAARSRQTGVPVEALLERGVEGLSLPGADDPLKVLKVATVTEVLEDQPFDPTRTRTTLVVRCEGRPDPILVPAVATAEGWRVELVRALSVPSESGGQVLEAR